MVEEEAAPKGTTPPGATIVLAGHYGAHASMMGRFCPPGASSSDWTLEHDPSVHLRFVALTGDGGEWVVFRLAQKGGSTEHSVALVASIDAAVVATLAPHLVEKGAVNQLVVAVGASWAVATATLSPGLTWAAATIEENVPKSDVEFNATRAAAWPTDIAIRARAIRTIKHGKATKVELATAAAQKEREKKAKDDAAKAAKEAGGEEEEAPKCAMPEQPGAAAKEEGAVDEDFDYATEWYPLPATKASQWCPLCAHCRAYNALFSVASMFGAAVEAASQIILYWLIFRFVAAYLDTQGSEAQWNKGIQTSIAMAIIGVVSSFGVFLQHTLLPISLDNQMARIRLRFMERALAQELTWYDLSPAGGLAGALSAGVNAWRGALSGMGIPQIGNMIGGFSATVVLMFVTSWRAALLVVATVPIYLIVMGTGELVPPPRPAPAPRCPSHSDCRLPLSSLPFSSPSQRWS